MKIILYFLLSIVAPLAISAAPASDLDQGEGVVENLENKAEAKKKIPAAALKFRTAGWTNIREALYYEVYRKKSSSAKKSKKQTKEYAKLTLSEMQQSSLCFGMPNSKVNFYVKEVKEEGVVYRPVATATLNGGNAVNGKYIFLFFAQKEAGKYLIYTVPDNPQDSEPASYQFHNLTNSNIFGFLKKNKFQLSAKKRVTTINVDKNKPESLLFGLYDKIENGKPHWIARNTFRSSPDKHLKLFIKTTLDVNGRVKLKMKGLVDFRESKVAL